MNVCSSTVLEFEPIEVCLHVFVLGNSVVVEDMVAPFFVVGTTQITTDYLLMNVNNVQCFQQWELDGSFTSDLP